MRPLIFLPFTSDTDGGRGRGGGGGGGEGGGGGHSIDNEDEQKGISSAATWLSDSVEVRYSADQRGRHVVAARDIRSVKKKMKGAHYSGTRLMGRPRPSPCPQAQTVSHCRIVNFETLRENEPTNSGDFIFLRSADTERDVFCFQARGGHFRGEPGGLHPQAGGRGRGRAEQGAGEDEAKRRKTLRIVSQARLRKNRISTIFTFGGQIPLGRKSDRMTSRRLRD